MILQRIRGAYELHRAGRQEPVRINVGCGSTAFPGWYNVDNSPSVILSRMPLLKLLLYRMRLLSPTHYNANWPDNILWLDASRRLPFSSGSVSRIYSSHFLEHLPYEKALNVLSECHRLLVPGGVFRLVVPDLYYFARQYVQTTELTLDEPLERLTRQPHDTFLDTVCGAYLNSRRSAHCYMYDWATLYLILAGIGFRDIRRRAAGESEDPELRGLDNRPDESLIIEMRR